MITCLDNRLCDFWWDDITKYTNRIDWERHQLTPELVKTQLLLNKWVVFQGEGCIWMGYFTYEPNKQFFITFVSGRGLVKEIKCFLDYMSDRYACNYTIGLTLPGMKRLYSKMNNVLNIGAITYKDFYEIDLCKYQTYDPGKDPDIIFLNPFYINNWISQIPYDIIPRDFINGAISAYKVGDRIIIGSLVNDLVKKYFNVVYVSPDFTQKDMTAFFYFIEVQMMCRYVNCSDSFSRLLDTNNEGIRKLGLTTFERKNNNDLLTTTQTILP